MLKHWCDNEECVCRTCKRNEKRRSNGLCGNCTTCSIEEKNYHAERQGCNEYSSAIKD